MREDTRKRIGIKPANEDIAKLAGVEYYDTSDLVGSLRFGSMKLVDIEDFQEKAVNLDNQAKNTLIRVGVFG